MEANCGIVRSVGGLIVPAPVRSNKLAVNAFGGPICTEIFCTKLDGNFPCFFISSIAHHLSDYGIDPLSSNTATGSNKKQKALRMEAAIIDIRDQFISNPMTSEYDPRTKISLMSRCAFAYMGGTSKLEIQTRSQILICPIGHYCTRGVKRPCPRGRYGNTEGLHTRDCSGSSALGYWTRY